MWKPVLTLIMVAGIIAMALTNDYSDPLGEAITRHISSQKQISKISR
ncbi:MAG: hypothetical protein G3M78_13770 [Candidatus Nitrohelix vancouverensis]|uniref:Uncharacterized protein n=1 Tax=Candidatus Nitrohelix vancouverensis TaxID=2705534 RepID=A0A7T0G4K1_9BACT|nr:MAG: hypothetical protein G3M78_13770 [Candidatus Nitrohelix vancouverensis]